MVYIVTVTSMELSALEPKLQERQRFTVALPRNREPGFNVGQGARLLLLLSSENASRIGGYRRRLAWMGVLAHRNTVGPIDKSVTIEPMRYCGDSIHLDGESGLLRELTEEQRRAFESASPRDMTGECSDDTWAAIDTAIRRRHPRIVPLLDWLLAQANPAVLDSRDPADRSWQEQRDAVRTLLRIADFPSSALAAWRRPSSRDAPYLAGLIPQPSEQSLIEHDVRVAARAFKMSGDWTGKHQSQCNIHVLTDPSGRRLEVANVNATSVEARTGTDMIYYHERTLSFVLVQYKRLDPDERQVYVDKRLQSQLERLQNVADKSPDPKAPSDWCLGNDPCFLKLAYWPHVHSELQSNELTPGMYLPISYIRLLLADDSTRGQRSDSSTRILGYNQVERYLVNSQFIQLVKNGLVGTIGTTSGDLRGIIHQSVAQGKDVMVAAERGEETVKERHRRVHARGSTKVRKGGSKEGTGSHATLFDELGQDSLFEL